MDDKTYHQEIVPDNPFPGEPELVPQAGQANPTGTFTQTVSKDKTFPKKRIAVELLSTALNTRSRKILENFQLQQSGGLQVGDFKEEISGDLRITPNGITARDIAGLTTFAIDGTTGDAVFKGIIQSGSVITGAVITGDITLGGAGNGDGTLDIFDNNNVQRLVADNSGLIIYDAAGLEMFKADYVEELTIIKNLKITTSFKVYDGVTLLITFDSGGAAIDADIVMGTNNSLTLRGTSTPNAPADTGAKLYVDQSGGKDRLMVRFNTGASQQIAIEP